MVHLVKKQNSQLNHRSHWRIYMRSDESEKYAVVEYQ